MRKSKMIKLEQEELANKIQKNIIKYLIKNYSKKSFIEAIMKARRGGLTPETLGSYEIRQSENYGENYITDPNNKERDLIRSIVLFGIQYSKNIEEFVG